MHELSIAMSLVDAACEEAAKLGGVRVNALHLRLGPLAGVVKDALLFSYDIACQDTQIAGSRLVIEDVPLVVFCPACQAPRTLESVQSLTCSECGAPTPEVREGRELELVGLEIDE